MADNYLDLDGLDDIKLIVAAAHELRNPLTIIRGMSSMLEDETFGKLRVRQKEQVRHITKASRRLGMLVDSLVHLDNLHQEQHRQLLQLQTQIEQVIDELSEAAADKDITIEFKPRRMPLIHANRSNMFQLLLHVISNSIRYAPEGSVVKIGTRREGGHVAMSVMTSGIGVSPKEIRTIKDKLGRQRQPVRAHSSSSGLGMFIAQTIVELYGGSLHAVRHSSGHGVVLKLPATKQLKLW